MIENHRAKSKASQAVVIKLVTSQDRWLMIMNHSNKDLLTAHGSVVDFILTPPSCPPNGHLPDLAPVIPNYKLLDLLVGGGVDNAVRHCHDWEQPLLANVRYIVGELHGAGVRSAGATEDLDHVVCDGSGVAD